MASSEEVSLLRTSEYLLERLADHNVGHIFGIRGDYVVPFFAHAEKSGVRVVTTLSSSRSVSLQKERSPNRKGVAGPS